MREYGTDIITGERREFIKDIQIKLCGNRFTDISKVVLFGSVARGDYINASDFDFAIISDSLTNAKLMRSDDANTVWNIIYEVLGLNSKYECDILYFGSNKSKEGIYANIEAEGVILYDKEVFFGV